MPSEEMVGHAMRVLGVAANRVEGSSIHTEVISGFTDTI
jgi:hypothetical protein